MRDDFDASRLVPRGYGDSKPVVANDNPANMAKNRRVELRRL
jgi:outer membrane protein OmpA-like peptidoglycan-associated protein